MERIVSFVREHVNPTVTSVHGYVVGLALCLPVSYFIYMRYMDRKMRLKMKARAQRSKDNIEELRKELEAHASDIDLALVELSLKDLQEMLLEGKVTATKVLRSYQAKALAVNDEVNAITDVIQDAADTARRLDALHSSQRGPLHGVPISLKESCGLKGLDCTAAFGELIDKPKEVDSVQVQVLKSLGAIPFIRTNLPQGMASLACSNPIYGATLNPLDKQRSPGGSSGGEGAIISGKGSILGLGSDVGGSIRIPACWCGLAALKPTAERLSFTGNFSHEELCTQINVLTSGGPLARDVHSLVYFMECVLCPKHFTIDPFVPPIPFRRKIYESKRPLKIGYYIHDDCTRCVPAVERAVLMCKSTLQSLGHDVVEVEPFQPMRVFSEILLPTLLGDNGKGFDSLVKHDHSYKPLMRLLKFQRKPYFLRWIIAKIREMRTYDPITVQMMKREQLRSAPDWFRMSRDLMFFREIYTKRWQKLGLDVMICPCMPCVAPTTGLDTMITGAATYTSFFNVVNFPAGTLPVTAVTKSDIAKTMDPEYYNAKTDMEKMIQRDSEGTEGLPVGVQVVARPYMEEKVLRVMTELENALKS